MPSPILYRCVSLRVRLDLFKGDLVAFFPRIYSIVKPFRLAAFYNVDRRLTVRVNHHLAPQAGSNFIRYQNADRFDIKFRVDLYVNVHLQSVNPCFTIREDYGARCPFVKNFPRMN